ncbi:MAG: hypothetical protein HKN76_06150 [Saprospiraceae bacterium]|nr:hypothetical protein [Saprospiraceae bacterium]
MNSFKRTKIIQLVLVIVGFLGCFAVQAQVNLIDAIILQADAENMVEIDLTFEVDSGYYIQSNQPLDKYLIPTDFTVTECSGLVIRDIYFDSNPKLGKNHSDSEEILEGRFNVSIQGLHMRNNISLRGILEFQACNQLQCFFPREKVVAISFPAVGPMPASGE